MEIMEVAARHLATRPRSTVELENYLIKKEFQEADIKDAVRKLTENGYLNDSEYARTYIRYALGKRKSLFRIKYELKEKGVSVEEIAEFVPEKAMTPPASISVYETRDDGSVLHLAPCQSLPSDKNILNHEMLMQNERFADLLELEERFCR